MEKWQARKKLNRDPAAFTSLRVACRYSSRPPSNPLKTYLSRTRLSNRVLLLLQGFFLAFCWLDEHFAAATYNGCAFLRHNAGASARQNLSPGRDKFLPFCHKP
jgi:hypothetical protein